METNKIRRLPGWEDSPIPICFGGDTRALAFCCKQVHAMPPGYECTRNEKLAEIGMTPEEFVQLKEEFSRDNEPEWTADETCYGSLVYCCMRTGGCPGRDAALSRVYGNKDSAEAFEEYFSRKKELAELILSHARSSLAERNEER